MLYLKGQTWLTLRAATGIIDHGVKAGIPVEQRAKASVFREKTEGLQPWKSLGNVKSRGQLYHEYVMHACSERASQTLLF